MVVYRSRVDDFHALHPNGSMLSRLSFSQEPACSVHRSNQATETKRPFIVMSSVGNNPQRNCTLFPPLVMRHETSPLVPHRPSHAPLFIFTHCLFSISSPSPRCLWFRSNLAFSM